MPAIMGDPYQEMLKRKRRVTLNPFEGVERRDPIELAAPTPQIQSLGQPIDYRSQLPGISNLGKTAPPTYLPKPKPPMQMPQVSIPQMPKPMGGDEFQRFIKAIFGQESGGNYKAKSPAGALGKYQIMPGNIPSWSKEILGRSISAQDFYNSPQLQDQIAQGKLQQYVNKYGFEGAAKAWYAGPGNAYTNSNKTQAGGFPSINAYAQSILNRMKG